MASVVEVQPPAEHPCSTWGAYYYYMLVKLSASGCSGQRGLLSYIQRGLLSYIAFAIRPRDGVGILLPQFGQHSQLFTMFVCTCLEEHLGS